MNQQEVFRKTGAILRELNEQYEYLQNTVDNLNDLELELFVANTHFLKDHAEILRKLNLQRAEIQHTLPAHTEEPEEIKTIEIKAVEEKPVEEIVFEIKKPISEEPKYFEPLVQKVKPVTEPVPFKAVEFKQLETKLEITSSENSNSAPQINFDLGKNDAELSELKDPEIIRHELVINDTEEYEEVNNTPVVTEPVLIQPVVTLETLLDEHVTEDETQEPNIIPATPEPVIDNTPKVKADEPVTIAEPVVAEEKILTLNQRISAQLKGQLDVSTKSIEPPITDIKSAISLNDKLLFVKDLFNGYSLAYSEAIEIVNRFTTFEEADRFLKTNYVTKNNWEGKKATSDKFYALLKRRYA